MTIVCPSFFNLSANAIYGWTSPRDPIVSIANLRGLKLLALSLGLLATNGIYARASSGQARVPKSTSMGGARTSAGCSRFDAASASLAGSERPLLSKSFACEFEAVSLLDLSDFGNLASPESSSIALMCLITCASAPNYRYTEVIYL
jgi:hypothetical protein